MPTKTPRAISPRQVRAWRTTHNLTMEEAAEAFAISDRQWSRYENGHAPIPGWLRRAVQYGIGPLGGAR